MAESRPHSPSYRPLPARRVNLSFPDRKISEAFLEFAEPLLEKEGAPPKVVRLEDGSTAILDSDSHVRTQFEADLRRIELLRGQALFKVTHDARRPFDVTAARTTVRAVGTEFSVRLRDPDTRGKEQVEVLVSEGRVRVVAGTAQMQEVSAGERAVTNGDRLSLSEHPTPGVEYSMSWTRGLLLFNGETLAEAASRFNQYGGAQFEIVDASIAKQRIAGNVRIGRRNLSTCCRFTASRV